VLNKIDSTETYSAIAVIGYYNLFLPLLLLMLPLPVMLVMIMARAIKPTNEAFPLADHDLFDFFVILSIVWPQ
jgi:hypothetical protein